ncbi:MarR family transcriptional regulator [Wukongibacter baidiensis]|uniref:MarR family winged helix-turn-helix transcriptional regulator n=1 Tax=Wukongibacter baidiensis TaxID=1723361 RepID=UPI003D7F3A1E
MDHDLNFLSEDLFTIFRLFHKNIFTPPSSNKKESLTRSHFEVMFALDDIGTSPMSEIAKRLFVSKPYMTSLVDKLVDMMLVEKVPDKKDRRIKNIALTKKGEKILMDHRMEVENKVALKLSKLSEEDLQQLLLASKDMKKIISKLYFED